MTDLDGPAVLADAVHRAALARVATTGPHWVSLVVQTGRRPPGDAEHGRGRAPRPTARRGPAAHAGADPQVGSGLGPWAERPGSVGELLAARSTGRAGGGAPRRAARSGAALACEVAALLALEMVAAVADQLAGVPLTPEG